jgi:hypothetical protein
MNVPFTLFSIIDGAPRSGLVATTAITVFKRLAADASITDLTPPSPIVDDGSGAYHFSFSDTLMLPGSTIQYVIRYTQLDAGGNSVTQYLQGEIDGGRVSISTGTAVEVVPGRKGFADLRFKVGNTLPVIRQTLKNDVGTVLDLTGATVQFRMREPGQALKVNRAAVVIDAPNGVVQYAWQTGDTDTAGLFSAEWAVTYGSDVETVPADGFCKILIEPSLA